MKILIIIFLLTGCTVYKYECQHLKPEKLKPLPESGDVVSWGRVINWFDDGTGQLMDSSNYKLMWPESEINIDTLKTGYHSKNCKCSTCKN